MKDNQVRPGVENLDSWTLLLIPQICMKAKLTLTIDNQIYLVEVASSDRWYWRLIKPDGKSYLVSRNFVGLRCSCPWAMYHPKDHCKHIAAMISVGLLPASN